MTFLGQAVIITAMALISVSLGGVSYLLLNVSLESAILTALGLFGFLIVLQTAVWRTRDRRQTSRDLQDLGHALENMTRDLAVINNKVNAFEQAGVIRAAQDVGALRTAVQGIATEMGQITETLQQHYTLIEASRVVPAASFGQRRSQFAPEQPAIAAHAAPMPEIAEDTAEEMVPQPPQQRMGRLGHLSDADAVAVVREIVDQGRIEIMLQPIVTLPQRRIRSYELLSRLRTADGDTLLPEDFLPYLRGELGATFDSLVLFRAVQLVRRMQTRNKEIGLTVNLCAATFSGGNAFASIVEFLTANRALAPSLRLEISQTTYADFGPLEFESMNAISALGFRFSLDNVRDLRLDIKGLFDRSFTAVKVPGDVLLGRAFDLPSDIHPADLSSLLGRSGIELIADRIESESTVIDLLDYDVRAAQGFLFAPPRPVKADVLDMDSHDAAPAAAMTA